MPRLKSRIPQIVPLLAGLIYAGLLVRNLREHQHRTFHLHSDSSATDNVRIPIRILSTDLNNGEVKAIMGFELHGKIAIDAATPAVDLKLYLNSSRGPREIEFPKGKRLNSVEAVFDAAGDVDGYPFDQYAASMSAKMVIPPRPTAEEKRESVTLEHDTPVPIEVDFSGSAPGVRFQQQSKMGKSQIGFLPGELAIITFYMRRADNVIMTSIFVTVLMLGLGMGVLAMVMQVTVNAKESPLLPLSLCVSLIFGLPALRNLQPSVPPLGVLCDYFAYVWAEITVAASAIAVVWTWYFRSRAKDGPEHCVPSPAK